MFFKPARCFGWSALIVALVFAVSCSTSGPYTETEHHSFLWIIGRPAKSNPTDQLAHARKLQEEGDAKGASKAFRALTIRWPGSVEAPVAQLEYARWLDSRGQFSDAFDEYQKLMDNYSGQFPYDEVLQRQFEIAKVVLSARKGKFLFFGGFKAPERAAPLFESVVRNGPRSPYAAEAQYLAGRAYELSEQYELAIVDYLTVQSLHPESPFADEATFGRASCWYLMASGSPNDEEALDQAWTAVSIFIATYPRSAHLDDVKKMKEDLYRRRALVVYNRATYYDKIAHKPESALMTYQTFVKLFPTSEWTTVSQDRIRQLSQNVEKKDEK